MRLPWILILPLLVLPICPATSWAGDDFKINNPDIKKYEFARSYITALGYLKNIDRRWEKNNPKTIYKGKDEEIIKASINYLALGNAELRIAKNYLSPYLSSGNAMLRKVADGFILACDENIRINEEEHNVWDQWAYLRKSGLGTRNNETVFNDTQKSLSLRRKENDKAIIQTTILMTKVLRSADNKDENGHLLAITQEQRKKLLIKLDSYGKDVLDWGIKPKQRTLNASIAVIREILEDSIWTAIDEK